MCQLTLIHILNRKYLNIARKLSLTSMYTNTHTKHQDGCGIAYIARNGQVKLLASGLTPQDIAEMPECFGSFTNTPVMLHARLSTAKNTASKPEFAHPFESESVILSHNGTLEFVERNLREATKLDYPDMIDSQIFLDVFEKTLKGEPDFVRALQKTMLLFAGKFAFLLYDKRNKDWYVVRGKSALLHYVELFHKKEKIGILINTEIESLKETMNRTEASLKVDFPKEKFNFGETYLMKEETIYKLDSKEGKLSLVGDIPENTVSYRYTSTSGRLSDNEMDDYWTRVYGHPYPYTDIDRTRSNSTGESVPKINGNSGEQCAEILLKFSETYHLSLRELERLSYITCGIGLLNQTLNSFAIFYQETLKPIEEYFTSIKGGKVMLETRIKYIRRIKMRTRKSIEDIYLYAFFEELEFPMILTDTTTLHNVEVATRKGVTK